MTVYLDSVFALNFAVNWLLLRAAARLGAAAVRPRRIAAAAALGAAYAVAVYLPGCGLLAGWAGKLAMTAALLAVAFGLRRETLRLAAVFGGGDAGAVRRGIRAGAAEARPRAPRRAVVPRNVLVARADGGRGIRRDTPAAAPAEPRAGQRRARAG